LLTSQQFQPICVGASQNVTSTLSEDCLFINVFAPSDVTPDSKLPVWFYIQGGGYATNSNANYNGTDVVVNSGHGLILVNFNYRVGALGFLTSETVRRDGDLNVGLLDQRKALEWVQQYIHLVGDCYVDFLQRELTRSSSEATLTTWLSMVLQPVVALSRSTLQLTTAETTVYSLGRSRSHHSFQHTEGSIRWSSSSSDF
jgi:hypothetical protein